MIPIEHSVTVIWQIKDGKRGHENQSRGLIQAISKLRPVDCVEVDVRLQGASWFDYLLGRRAKFSDLPQPNLIIGAGSQTHATILAAGRATQTPTIVMMAPPRGISSRFDLCIVPEHDGRKGSNVITTKGVLNPIELRTSKSTTKGLFLIGGASKHHGWSGQQIIEQISRIVEQSPEINWTATTSRRSPVATSTELALINAGNLKVVPVEQTDDNWLPTQLSNAFYVWVTEDSVSMIYEALSSGAKVGILPVPRKTKISRVIRGVDLLIQAGQVLSYDSNQCDLFTFDAPEPLNEAGRIAQIVAGKFLESAS